MDFQYHLKYFKCNNTKLNLVFNIVHFTYGLKTWKQKKKIRGLVLMTMLRKNKSLR